MDRFQKTVSAQSNSMYPRGLLALFYRIDLEYPEIELYVDADNVVELREKFINAMTSLFDNTIQDRLKS